MDEHELKPILSNNKKFDILNIPKDSPIFDKIHNPNLLMQNFQYNTPEIKPIDRTPIIIKEEHIPKKGIEGWYERNTGKIALFFAILSILLAIVAIFEGWLLAQPPK